MRLKSKTLEKVINKSISDMKNSSHDNEVFAIHNEGNIQIQIVVTSDSWDIMDELLSEYVDAVEQ